MGGRRYLPPYLWQNWPRVLHTTTTLFPLHHGTKMLRDDNGALTHSTIKGYPKWELCAQCLQWHGRQNCTRYSPSKTGDGEAKRSPWLWKESSPTRAIENSSPAVGGNNPFWEATRGAGVAGKKENWPYQKSNCDYNISYTMVIYTDQYVLL